MATPPKAQFHCRIFQQQQQQPLLYWFAIFLLIIHAISVHGLPDHISAKEKEAIEKFRPMVEKHLTRDFQKSDAYLVTWLRAKKLNLKEAEAFLMKALEWRKKRKLDDGASEDWSKFKQYDLLYTSGVDRKGNPVLYSRYGVWDIRKAVLAGQADQLMKYIDYAGMEAPMIRSYEKSVAEGRNSSVQVTFLLDMGGYNLRNGGCLGCLPVHLHWPGTFEFYFPQIYDKILMINTPVVFETVLTAARPLFTQYTKEDLIVLGIGKEKWEKEVDKWISKDQLPKALGGKKSYH